jgi:hypothetical protein
MEFEFLTAPVQRQIQQTRTQAWPDGLKLPTMLLLPTTLALEVDR